MNGERAALVVAGMIGMWLMIAALIATLSVGWKGQYQLSSTSTAAQPVEYVENVKVYENY